MLADHLNAEIVAGTITTKQDALDYMTWTYLFRRLLMNPSYYQLEGCSPEDVNVFLSTVVANALRELESSFCVAVDVVRSAVQYSSSKHHWCSCIYNVFVSLHISMRF